MDLALPALAFAAFVLAQFAAVVTIQASQRSPNSDLPTSDVPQSDSSPTSQMTAAQP